MAKVYDAIISVLNQASGPILQIEKDLNRMGGAATRAHMQMQPHQKLFHQLRETGGEIRGAAGEAGNAIGEIGGLVGEILPVLGGIGAVASLAGMVELVQRTSEASLNLQHMAITAGMTTQQLQVLDYVGSQVGVSAGDISTAMGRLNQRLGQVAVGQMKPLAAMLKHFGISLRDSKGHLRDAAQLLPQLQTLFSGMKDPVEQNAVAFQLFGRSYQEILPLLDMSQQKFKQSSDQFKIFGYTIQPENFVQLQEFGDAWENLNTAVESMLTDIASHLAPVLTPMINEFSRLIGVNKEWIATDIAGVIEWLGNALQTMPWKRIEADARVFLHTVENLYERMGGLRTIAIGLGVIMGVSLLNRVVSVGRSFVTLGAAVGVPLYEAFYAAGFAVGGLIADFVALIPTIASLRDLWAALNLVMDANPLGVIVIAAGALVALGVAVYDNWQRVKGLFASMGGGDGSDSFGPHRLPNGEIYHPGFHGGYYSRTAFETGDEAARPQFWNGSYTRTAYDVDDDGGTAPAGQVQVHVQFDNAPAGTRVSARSSGAVAAPKLRLGYNSMVAS